MIIAAEYSFSNGCAIQKTLLQEVEDIIAVVDALSCKTKKSKEKTMKGKMLYSPTDLNNAFAQGFESKGWRKKRVSIPQPTIADHYRSGYLRKQMRPAYREIDFLKERLGIEVQFGVYQSMVYDVYVKFPIFRNLGYIDAGIEIVPVKSFTDEMSTSVPYFERFVWELKASGVVDIDIPVLIFGIDA
ncbi:MAG: BglII/BstYI family type II restriction endonuclease [Candidatus Poribacteria bacterium]|nr:BglII/BstYI family type II restriction endonuclease [Candidatus Poribacteria bacterium]